MYIYTMIITQTLEIPADRRITIEVPPQIPAGRARVELNVISFAKREEKPAEPTPQKLRLTKTEFEEIMQNAETPHSDALTGILADCGDTTVEQIRDERLARHL